MKNPLTSIRYRVRSLKRRIRTLSESLLREKPHDSKYERTIRNAIANCGDVAGKHVLEIGSDPSGTLLQQLVNQFGAAKAVGVNPCLSTSSDKGRYALLREDACQMSLPDESVDLIVSISVFEHIMHLPDALKEMHRVLTPGGCVFSEYGPIWSSAWGHHLWFYHNGQVVDWNSHVLPPYAHLLMDETRLCDWCTEKFRDKELAQKITKFVHHSEEQNKLFFSDYESIYRDSPLDVVCVTGYPDFPLSQRLSTGNSPEIFYQLKKKYPDKSGFGYHVMTACLTKPQ